MNNKLISMLLALFFMLALTKGAAIAQDVTKEKTCAGGCCGGKSIDMTNMQNHDMQKHEQHQNDTTATKDAKTNNQHEHKQSIKETDIKKDNGKNDVEYTCPMHPEVKSAKPGKCPKCGMALVTAKKEETSLMKKKM